jgi:hypothetical protein
MPALARVPPHAHGSLTDSLAAGDQGQQQATALQANWPASTLTDSSRQEGSPTEKRTVYRRAAGRRSGHPACTASPACSPCDPTADVRHILATRYATCGLGNWGSGLRPLVLDATHRRPGGAPHDRAVAVREHRWPEWMSQTSTVTVWCWCSPAERDLPPGRDLRPGDHNDGSPLVRPATTAQGRTSLRR